MNKLTYIIVVIILIGCSQKKNQETVSEEATTVSEGKIAKELLSAEDSMYIESLIQDLQGIEKHAVEVYFHRMMALLRFNADNNSDKVNTLLKKVEWNSSYKGAIFKVVDKKNGYAQFSTSHSEIQAVGHLSIAYWNLVDGSKLIAYSGTRCDMFCNAEISFKKYQNGSYQSIENQLIIPEIKKLNEILEFDKVDGGADFEFRLPQNGKNIEYCINDKCIELVWNDGVFLEGERNVNGSVHGFDISISTTNNFPEGDLKHFILKSAVLSDEYLKKINEWTPGSVLDNTELNILYGTNYLETIQSWYGLQESRPESMKIVDKKDMGAITYVTYQFSKEEEDYRGNIVCIRSLKGGQWQGEISFNSVKDVRMGASGNSFSYNGQMDYTSDPDQLLIKKTVNSLLINYMDVDYSTIDLPMNHEVVTTSAFDIVDISSLQVAQKGKTEQHNFPLTKEGIEKVKKDNSVQYYIDQANTLDNSYKDQKNEIIAYLNRIQEELLEK